MPEVFRYLEARDSEKVKCKPKDKGSINAESGGHSQSVRVVDECFFFALFPPFDHSSLFSLMSYLSTFA